MFLIAIELLWVKTTEFVPDIHRNDNVLGVFETLGRAGVWGKRRHY